MHVGFDLESTFEYIPKAFAPFQSECGSGNRYSLGAYGLGLNYIVMKVSYSLPF